MQLYFTLCICTLDIRWQVFITNPSQAENSIACHEQEWKQH